eukprot:RCo039116
MSTVTGSMGELAGLAGQVLLLALLAVVSPARRVLRWVARGGVHVLGATESTLRRASSSLQSCCYPDEEEGGCGLPSFHPERRGDFPSSSYLSPAPSPLPLHVSPPELTPGPSPSRRVHCRLVAEEKP